MAQPRPSRAHVTCRIAALALLAAAPAGTYSIPSSDHPTRLAGGIPLFHPYQLMWAAAAAILPAPARLLGRQAIGVMAVHGTRGAQRHSDARRLS